jgi:hypothetical protein
MRGTLIMKKQTQSETFDHRITCGWLRDLASEPTPHDTWPCIRWDDQLVADQERFLDAQAEYGVTINSVWGLFVDRAWPTDLKQAAARGDHVKQFTAAAHERGLKLVTGLGVYSWGFDQIIREHPEVAASDGNKHVMCPFQPAAWEWQRRVLDFVLDPQWGIDGASMQSADQGRCDCPRCKKRSNAEHHAELLIRCAEYARRQRPDWVIGTSCWGLRVDEPEALAHIVHMSKALDYILEVDELSHRKGLRPDIVRQLHSAFGSVGGGFVEPPQHWDRLRWFVPLALGPAQSVGQLWRDGGRACEIYYRPFANPGEEVAWRTSARMLQQPTLEPHVALREAVGRVYGVSGDGLEQLADWYIEAERAYLDRSTYKVGQGPLSLEPLWWNKHPDAAGPPLYLQDKMKPEDREAYAADLRQLRDRFARIAIPNHQAAADTLGGIDGTLAEITAVQNGAAATWE